MSQSPPRPASPSRRSALAVVAAAAVAWLTAGSAAMAADDDLDVLLTRYVASAPDGINRADYARWHAAGADRALLDAYIARQAAMAPSQLPRNAAFAYWANLYNALTMKVVLDNYPVKSIRDIKSEGVWLDPKAYLGPWRSPRVTVEGRALSLDAIENEIMRPTFKDPRVHYSINCASLGCPNLRPKTWRADTLDADLDAAARAYVNHPRGVTIADGRLVVSSIYVWFKDDFGGSDEAVVRHLERYADPELARKLGKVRGIAKDAYDWSLNATPARGRS